MRRAACVALLLLVGVVAETAEADPCSAGPGCTRSLCRDCGISPTTGQLSCLRMAPEQDGACGCTIQGSPPYACGLVGTCAYDSVGCKVVGGGGGQVVCRFLPPARTELPPARGMRGQRLLGPRGLVLTFPLS